MPTCTNTAGFLCYHPPFKEETDTGRAMGPTQPLVSSLSSQRWHQCRLTWLRRRQRSRSTVPLQNEHLNLLVLQTRGRIYQTSIIYSLSLVAGPKHETSRPSVTSVLPLFTPALTWLIFKEPVKLKKPRTKLPFPHSIPRDQCQEWIKRSRETT